eukprot:TRINITY_DN5397_c0_g2_i1.p1 TRINITY_DN5397_c0_g2~~TRINITY_DN5397_c0_g2_i1.p1  ORF type:complete len:258 (+),score=38.51 TRINITY_DN5397_c0_g2_i1:91-774(+)
MASEDMRLQAKPHSSIGLSDAAEQRWRQLTGGRHLLPAVAGLLEEDVQNNVRNQLRPVPPLAQTMGFACGRRPMDQAYEDVTPAAMPHLSRAVHRGESGDEASTPARSGISMTAARPTQQLLDEMSQDPNSPPLPPLFQSWKDAGPFVPPDGEEWHVIHGWHVRISAAEMQELLEQAEASESEDEDDVDSQTDTTYRFGSACDSEDDESTKGSEQWSDETMMENPEA